MTNSSNPPPQLIDELKQIVGSNRVSLDANDLETYGRDWTRVYAPAPSAVVFPGSTKEVAALVRACAAHKVPIVPSGGRTGLSAGAVATNGEIVLSLDRLNFIDDPCPLARTLTSGCRCNHRRSTRQSGDGRFNLARRLCQRRFITNWRQHRYQCRRRSSGAIWAHATVGLRLNRGHRRRRDPGAQW